MIQTQNSIAVIYILKNFPLPIVFFNFPRFGKFSPVEDTKKNCEISLLRANNPNTLRGKSYVRREM